jgi:alkylated DNA repair dioxygenase AlkB
MTGNCWNWDATDFEYREAFLAPEEADACLDRLWHELAWEQREISLFGRRVLQPRLIAWYGDRDAAYSYSGLQLEPRPWHPLLQTLRDRVEEAAGSRFNSVLANAYRDGNDSMGWHSDDEAELGARPGIASLSLGAERTFLLRRASALRQPGEKSRKLLLAHGSLLVMRGDSQKKYQHSVPKTRPETGLRINLTYRLVRAQEA